MALGWESSLEAAGILVVAAPSPGSIPNPLGVWVAPEGGVVVIRNPVRLNSDFVKFRTSVVFELQRAGVVLGLNWP